MMQIYPQVAIDRSLPPRENARIAKEWNRSFEIQTRIKRFGE